MLKLTAVVSGLRRGRDELPILSLGHSVHPSMHCCTMMYTKPYSVYSNLKMDKKCFAKYLSFRVFLSPSTFDVPIFSVLYIRRPLRVYRGLNQRSFWSRLSYTITCISAKVFNRKQLIRPDTSYRTGGILSKSGEFRMSYLLRVHDTTVKRSLEISL